MGLSHCGVYLVLFFQFRYFLLRQESEVFQIANDITVVSANPELVELVDACARVIEPDGVGFGLAEFASAGIGDEWSDRKSVV